MDIRLRALLSLTLLVVTLLAYGTSLAEPVKGSPEPDIIVAVESMDTRHSLRDRFLRGPAFFDAARFPTIRFSQVRLLNGNNVRKQLTGNLTLRGITQNATPPALAGGVVTGTATEPNTTS